MAIDSGLLFAVKGCACTLLVGWMIRLGFCAAASMACLPFYAVATVSPALTRVLAISRKSGAASSTKNGFNGHGMLLLGDCCVGLDIQDIVLNDDFRNY